MFSFFLTFTYFKKQSSWVGLKKLFFSSKENIITALKVWIVQKKILSFKKFYLFIFIWLCQVFSCGMRDLCCIWELLVVACMRDLSPPPGTKPRPPALGARSLNRWTTREVPEKNSSQNYPPTPLDAMTRIIFT